MKHSKDSTHTIKRGEAFTLLFLSVGIAFNIAGMILALAIDVADYFIVNKPHVFVQAVAHINNNWYIETFAAIGVTGLAIGLALSVVFDNIKQKSTLSN